MVGSDVEPVRFLFEEAKDHHGTLLSWLSEMNGRAESLLRVNVLITGILATGVSLLARFGPQGLSGRLAMLFVAGFVLLISSTLLAVFSYLKRGISGGLEAQDLEAALVYDANTDELIEEALQAYTVGIIHNEDVMESSAATFRHALYTLAGAIVVLGFVAGTYLGRGI